jgi:hypothetical protein
LTEKLTGPNDRDLLTVLLERNILSRAQVEVARIDIAATGLSPVDVLLARKWISEQALSEFESDEKTAGAKNPHSSSSDPSTLSSSVDKEGKVFGVQVSNSSSSSEQIYLDNLRKYRQLIAKIMGEVD